MAEIRQEDIINNANFTATVTSPSIANDGRTAWVLVSKVGAMTTTPTMTVTINASFDGVSWYLIDTQTVINSANAVQRTVYAVGSTKGPILEPFIQVVATFGGSGSFANTTVALLGGGFFD
jgi:hypothetical protein